MAFPPGHRNNPAGRRREIPGVIELMKAHTIDAARTLCRLAKGGKGIPRELALRAAVALLDRVHGTPRQSLEVHGDAPRFVMNLPMKSMTADEWAAEAAAYQVGVPGAAGTRQLEHGKPTTDNDLCGHDADTETGRHANH